MTDSRFPPTSRYANVETAERIEADGRRRVYLRRRFVPDPARFTVLLEHRVREGQRLDQLAAMYLGDPEQFWRLADANGVLDPRDLEQLSRQLVISLPEGMAGPPSA